MRCYYVLLLVWGALAPLLAGCGKLLDAGIAPKEEVSFVQPAHFPSPTYDFAAKPITSAGFALGRALFYDPILSIDNTVSCGFCHLQTAGFTQHGHRLSHGVSPTEQTMRNSQPIMNLAWGQSFMWDGGIDRLDLFPPAPIHNEVEMGSTLSISLARLRQKPGYRDMFAKAYGDTAITLDRFLRAMSQFQLMCISADSKYDRVLLNKPGYAFSAEELAGKQIFESKCSRCHSGVLFTDERVHHNGLPINNAQDKGRYLITQNEADLFKFKTPSLRNLTYTGPYMHDGRFGTLRAVLDHYSSNINGPATVDDGLRGGIPLSEANKAHVIAFLMTLTDTTFITNPLLAAPPVLP